MGPDLKKRALRQMMVQKRLTLGPAEQVRLNELIQKQILEQWSPRWKNILMYINQPDEVETIPIIKKLISEGKNLCVPSYHSGTKFYFPSILQDFEKELEAGKFGILEPKEKFIRPFEAEKLDIIFIPGLAFDRKGNRLGYGFGFFDELCRSTKAFKIGLAYNLQMVEQLEPHDKDVRLNQIITEKEIIECLKP
jgi:5-formyltetrahydrofolate cyclo-ligase